MSKFLIFSFLFIFSCSSNHNIPEYQIDIVEDFDLEESSEQEVLDINDLYEFRSFNDLILDMDLSDVDPEELTKFENDANYFFETVSNKSSKEFFLDNSQIKIDLAVISSFEILVLRKFCREYSSRIDFTVADVSIVGVACRQDDGWKILKRIN
jgi:hypothetical protein